MEGEGILLSTLVFMSLQIDVLTALELLFISVTDPKAVMIRFRELVGIGVTDLPELPLSFLHEDSLPLESERAGEPGRLRLLRVVVMPDCCRLNADATNDLVASSGAVSFSVWLTTVTSFAYSSFA